jgi:hypothetical protein
VLKSPCLGLVPNRQGHKLSGGLTLWFKHAVMVPCVQCQPRLLCGGRCRSIQHDQQLFHNRSSSRVSSCTKTMMQACSSYDSSSSSQLLPYPSNPCAAEVRDVFFLLVLRRRCAESNLAYGLSITGKALGTPGGLTI